MAERTIIQTVREKIDRLIADNRTLRESLKKAAAERDRETLRRREAEAKIALLEKRVNTLETAKSFGGTRGDNRAARLRVNKLLREIDSCIAMMNK